MDLVHVCLAGVILVSPSERSWDFISGWEVKLKAKSFVVKGILKIDLCFKNGYKIDFIIVSIKCENKIKFQN